jgi:Ca2+/Na+ antiporter
MDLQSQFQIFTSDLVRLAIPILLLIALLIVIFLKRSFMSVLSLIIYLVLASLFSIGFYKSPESWSSEPQLIIAIEYGSALAAILFGFVWGIICSISSMTNPRR